jgi:hypothetical protein
LRHDTGGYGGQQGYGDPRGRLKHLEHRGGAQRQQVSPLFGKTGSMTIDQHAIARARAELYTAALPDILDLIG